MSPPSFSEGTVTGWARCVDRPPGCLKTAKKANLADLGVLGGSRDPPWGTPPGGPPRARNPAHAPPGGY